MDLKIKSLKKKGQVTLTNAGAGVMAVGFIFLIMMTIAFIGSEFQGSIDTNTYSVTNETVTNVVHTTQRVAKTSDCNFGDFTLTSVNNATGGESINSDNYTISASAGTIVSTITSEYNATNWNLSYSYVRAGTSCNVSKDMQTEVGSNTSIAGMVLTIVLVGLVMGVLIGIFVGVTGRERERTI